MIPAIPIKPQRWLTRTPIQERVEFPIPGGQGVADIYRPPGEGPHPAILLFLGVAPAGPDDPRVVNLGEALAEGILVGHPQMPEFRFGPDDVTAVIDYLNRIQSGTAKPNP